MATHGHTKVAFGPPHEQEDEEQSFFDNGGRYSGRTKVHKANKGKDLVSPKRSAAARKVKDNEAVTKSINKRIVGEASQRAISQGEDVVRAADERNTAPEGGKKKKGAPFTRKKGNG